MDKAELRYLQETHPDNYFSNGEAAVVLGVDPSTLREWARTGKLDGVDHFPHPFNGWRYFRAGDIYELRDARNAAEAEVEE
ncbi:MerR family transcriptional regulator [Nocardiopsis sp. FIRDI 009]|uniref:MerR family transcriptional regulator n=1 Tax=Nocardiopsis sp. FIRDI 009 TaxID=714197 RepID=UPI000E21F410|nr:MerR family transcriptional regulator [Nocardiopsis sp. FIRDI 009]